MRWLPCVLLAACSNAPGSGTLAYTEVGTGDIRVLDLASGDHRQLSGGPAGSVAISRDGQHVAFSRGDRIVRIADRAGTSVTELALPGRACTPTPSWGPNHSLQWCVTDATGSYTAFLPALGATPRLVATNRLRLTPDGARVAYLARAAPAGPSPRGDLVIEDADGANRRILRTDVDAYVLDVLPDGEHVLVSDQASDTSTSLQRIRIADGAVTELGPGGAYLDENADVAYSPDGSEVLTSTGQQLHALELATGARRLVAEVGPDDTIASALFVDAGRVVLTRHRDMSRGDIGMFVESIQIADDAGVRTIVDEPTEGLNNPCRATAVAVHAGFVVASCGGALMARFDGRLLGALPSAFGPLGLAADESGMVAIDTEGSVYFVTTGGDHHHLVDTVSVFAPPDADTGLQPFAAYAP
ncbi:MAG: hypothetical protein JNL83_08340 [Myxococcales bacterium]|nr:hypothetical protein [Myxococcales bacterium]